MKKLYLIMLLMFCSYSIIAQEVSDEEFISKIYDEALVNGQSYKMLEYLCLRIGPRLSGSEEAAEAVAYTKAKMDSLKFDNVFLQEVMVPHWVRGPKEKGFIIFGNEKIELNPLSLGNSIGTGKGGITAPVVMVYSLDELEEMNDKNIKDKIVFFNRPMDPSTIETFKAYGKAVDQRVAGPSSAARKGALAVVIRSVTTAHDDHPHTGTLRYADNAPKIPALAFSIQDADLLTSLLLKNKDLNLYLENYAEMKPDALSHNVIGELRGTESEDYIIAGGHLDSWDVGHGAHDDGAGCVQAIEALRILKKLGYEPRHNLRAVMFMNEENGLRGGIEYAAQAIKKNEHHLAAIESDRGGFTPRGFTMTGGEEAAREKVKTWKPLLEKYGLKDFDQAGGGADIGPLRPQGTLLMGYLPDSQRYFDYHHAGNDTFDKVNRRELELGAAAIASMIYLLDKYGLE
ncbi:MAG: M20/M25/M40 family metallo-hydrolase [Candidatus Cyclobacteriaceae bacterium M2_1C_046]